MDSLCIPSLGAPRWEAYVRPSDRIAEEAAGFPCVAGQPVFAGADSPVLGAQLHVAVGETHAAAAHSLGGSNSTNDHSVGRERSRSSCSPLGSSYFQWSDLTMKSHARLLAENYFDTASLGLDSMR